MPRTWRNDHVKFVTPPSSRRIRLRKRGVMQLFRPNTPSP